MPVSTLPRTLGLCALVPLFALPAQPADAQIATDRPDFVESSATVGAGAMQLETSVSYGRTGSGAGRLATWSTPTLIRLGVGDVFEFRLESDAWVWDASTASQGDDGFADIAVGFKWHLGDERGSTPSTAILVHADLPSGSEALRGDGVRPSLRAVAEWTLPSGLALGVMPGIALERESGSAFLAGIVGVVLGLELTASLRSFAEVSFEQLAAADRGGNVGTFNAGLALLLTENLQLDTGVAWGLTESAQDVSWGLGLSVLAPGG